MRQSTDQRTRSFVRVGLCSLILCAPFSIGWVRGEDSQRVDSASEDGAIRVTDSLLDDTQGSVQQAIFTTGDSGAAAESLSRNKEESSVRQVAATQEDMMVLTQDIINADATGVVLESSIPETDTSVVSFESPESLDLVSLEDRVRQLDQQVAAMQSQARNRNRSNQWERPGYFAAYESVLMQPAQSNSTGLIIETADGYSHVLFPWEIEHSPRVSLGYDPGNSTLGWRVRFWQFRHSEEFQANVANGLLPVGMEGTVGYLSEDGDITTGLAFIEEGEFSSHIRTDVIDWELQRRLGQVMNFYAGLRYAKVKQGYSAATDRGNLQSSSQFRGVGPTIALSMEHQLPLDRLILFSVARGSMLFGKKRFRVIDDVNNMSQNIGDIELRSGNNASNAMAGNAELQLGIRYEATDWLELNVALETQHYAEVGGANPSAVFAGPDSGLAGDSPLDDDLNLFGLSCGATLLY